MARDEDKNFWLNYCREVISPKMELACIVRHTSRSGLLREVQVISVNGGRILDVTHAVACATGLPQGKYGIKI
jgi:glycerol dehydrogenase-like iron-containing ADH family enzyme